MSDEERVALAAELERLLRPGVEMGGRYDCCGCSTYEAILDDAIAVVLGTYEPPPEARG